MRFGSSTRRWGSAATTGRRRPRSGDARFVTVDDLERQEARRQTTPPTRCSSGSSTPSRRSGRCTTTRWLDFTVPPLDDRSGGVIQRARDAATRWWSTRSCRRPEPRRAWRVPLGCRTLRRAGAARWSCTPPRRSRPVTPTSTTSRSPSRGLPCRRLAGQRPVDRRPLRRAGAGPVGCARALAPHPPGGLRAAATEVRWSPGADGDHPRRAPCGQRARRRRPSIG